MDHRTGQPFSRWAILRDLKVLREEWARNHKEENEEAQHFLLAQVQEVNKLGWQKDDGRLVLEAIREEYRMRGLEPPQRVHLSGPGGSAFINRIVIVDSGDGSDCTEPADEPSRLRPAVPPAA